MHILYHLWVFYRHNPSQRDLLFSPGFYTFVESFGLEHKNNFVAMMFQSLRFNVLYYFWDIDAKIIMYAQWLCVLPNPYYVTNVRLWWTSKTITFPFNLHSILHVLYSFVLHELTFCVIDESSFRGGRRMFLFSRSIRVNLQFIIVYWL